MEWMELSKAYSRNCLPVERDEIATPGNIERWEYLNLQGNNSEGQY